MMLVFQSLMYFSPSLCRHQEHQALTVSAVNKEIRSHIVPTPVACGDFYAEHSKPSFRTERGASPGRVGPLRPEYRVRACSPGGGRCGLGLPDGCAGYCPGQLVSADEEEGDRDRAQADQAAGPERPLEAAGESRGRRGALVQQGPDAAGRDRGRHRDADRTAELLGGVEQPGSQAGLVLGDPRQSAIETGMKANAVPTPVMMNGPARLVQK